MLDHGDSGCLPVVAAMLNPELEVSPYTPALLLRLATTYVKE
jgi:hypothetical protein